MAQKVESPQCSKPFQIILEFFKFYTFLILFSPIIALFAIYRLCISLIFILFFKNQLRLMDTSEGMFGIDSYANVITITYFVYTKGKMNIQNLQDRFQNTFLNFRDVKTSERAYEKLLCAIVPKWGFMCFKNTREDFNIGHHVRICQGYESEGTTHTEADVLNTVAKLTDELWPQNQPRWEVLVFPNIHHDNEVRNIVCLRFHHAYVDGISFAQICRNVLFDQPCPKLSLDPVNPNIPKIPWYAQVWSWILVFFLGPYTTTKLLTDNEENIFYEGPLTGNKFIGRSQFPVSMAKMRDVREAFGVCTSAVQHSAYLAAMHKIAAKKGFKVPKRVIGGAVFAHLPYPDEFPTNHIYFGADYVQMGIENARKRLIVVDQFYKKLATSMHDKMASGMLIRIVGLFPAALVIKTFGKIRYSYFVSNVPGISHPTRLQNNEVPLLFGIPPLVNGMRYGLGVGVYDSQFQFGFLFEQSQLISCQDDVNAFINYFDKEIEYLCALTKINNNLWKDPTLFPKRGSSTR